MGYRRLLQRATHLSILTLRQHHHCYHQLQCYQTQLLVGRASLRFALFCLLSPMPQFYKLDLIGARTQIKWFRYKIFLSTGLQNLLVEIQAEKDSNLKPEQDYEHHYPPVTVSIVARSRRLKGGRRYPHEGRQPHEGWRKGTWCLDEGQRETAHEGRVKGGRPHVGWNTTTRKNPPVLPLCCRTFLFCQFAPFIFRCDSIS